MNSGKNVLLVRCGNNSGPWQFSLGISAERKGKLFDPVAKKPDRDAYAAFAQKLSSPGWIIFNLIIFLFALYHSITWFYSSAIVLPLRIGEREMPRNLFVALNVGVLAVVSLVILVLFLALKG